MIRMATWFTALAVSVFLLASCKQAAPGNTASKSDTLFIEDKVPHALLGDNVVPQAYRIDMVMNPDDESYTGVVEIDVEIKKATQQIWMHGKNMTVRGAVAVVGTESIPLSFEELPASEAPSGIARITSEETLPAGKLTLRLPYETPYNMSLNSAYKVVKDDEAYIVTQFEPLGAREAFPSFDEPRFKIPFTLSITSPKEDFVFSNTPEVSATELDNGWVKHQFAQTLPLPTYLIAFGAGPYDVVEYADLPVTEVRDRPIKLRGIAAKGKGEKMDYALKNTAGIMEAIENYFAIPYPYEKLDLIAAPEYAFGAMENPGAIVYQEYLLLLDDNAPLSQKRAYASVHSHELAHQWFGNLVTPYWWEDIWLNEAFATWMGNKGITLWKPDGNFDRNNQRSSLGAMNLDSLASTRSIRTPLKRSENVMQQFDSITYRKGGGVLSMIESYLGEENFRKGVQLHMERFEHGVANADDFFQSLADGSGKPDVVDALKSFVDQPGVPLVDLEFTCEQITRKTPTGPVPAAKSSLTISQKRYAPLGSTTNTAQSWEIPVCVKPINGLESRGSNCTVLSDASKAFDQKASMEMLGKQICPVVMPNANGAGYYRFTMPSESWAALLNNIDKLNTREVLSTQDSLLAAYRAGEVDSAVYLQGVEKFARHPEYDVVSKAGDLLSFMDDHLPDAARADYERFVRDIYQAKYQSVVGTNTIEGQLLAPTLLGNMIYRANDKSLVSEYAQKGAAYLGLDGEANKSAVPPNLLSYALDSVVIEREEAAFDALLSLHRDGNQIEKGSALSAMVEVQDKDRAQSLLDMAMDENGQLDQNDAASVIFALMGKPIHSDNTWNWLKANFDDYVGNRVPDVFKPELAAFGSGFCASDKAKDLETFIESKAELIPGYEKRLAQTLETIELCAALKAAKINELAEALKNR